LKRLDFNLPKGNIVWQDSCLTDYEWEDFYLKEEQIEFVTGRKKTRLGAMLYKCSCQRAEPQTRGI
jgi:hypothetical protein